MNLRSPYQVTEGRVVFLLLYALLGVAEFGLIKWNMILSDVAVLGFIVLAQVCITRYFQNPNDDAQQTSIVFLCAIGYCVLLFESARLWNDKLSYGVATGFVLFLTRLTENYFATASSEPAVVPNPPTPPPVVLPAPPTP